MHQIEGFSFLGSAPRWYKILIVVFLAINPIMFFWINPFVAGWMLLLEFIVTLALALKCYPFAPGGLLAVEAIAIGMTSGDGVYHEVVGNLPTLLLLIFMVAGIYYLKDIILQAFAKVFISVRSKVMLSFLFCFISGIFSSFLDGLTLMSIIIVVCFNFYAIYNRASEIFHAAGDEDIKEFRGFLRNIVMHGAVGATLGGTLTLVGEPQNLMIGTKMGWSFAQFFQNCSPVTMPASLIGLFLCPLLEYVKFPGYGYQMPENIREIIVQVHLQESRSGRATLLLYITQILVGILLVAALTFHFAEVGIIGICIIILMTSFGGLTKEHDLGLAFNNVMPFVSLMVVFFAILSVVNDQHLLSPIVEYVFRLEGHGQLLALYVVNGILSVVSDSVFIASIFIKEVETAYSAGLFSSEHYRSLAVVVNMGTNIPSLATPNGQASFLFLLTSALAPVIRLSYWEMVKLALPYTVVTSLVGATAVYLFL